MLNSQDKHAFVCMDDAWSYTRFQEAAGSGDFLSKMTQQTEVFLSRSYATLWASPLCYHGLIVLYGRMELRNAPRISISHHEEHERKLAIAAQRSSSYTTQRFVKLHVALYDSVVLC